MHTNDLAVNNLKGLYAIKPNQQCHFTSPCFKSPFIPCCGKLFPNAEKNCGVEKHHAT